MGVHKVGAVFLDRDGTIVKQVESLHDAVQLRLISGAGKAIHAINRLGYFTAIVTNQPVIARGIITPRDLDQIHEALRKRLAEYGAIIDAIYYCPHHPNATVEKYRMVCDCRKPASGMILQAAKEHNLDLNKSFFVGDSTQDILAANRAKVKMILVRTGHGGKDPWQHGGKPDFVVGNLAAAAKVIAKAKK